MKNGRHIYTDEQIEFILANKELSRSELTTLFNEKFGTDLTVKSIRGKCERLGALSGRSGRFERGNKCKEPKPLGSERIHGSGYLQIRIESPPYWVQKNRYVWEQENGPIPEGYIVTHKDGDRLNCDISNLAMIKKSERSAMNGMGLNNLPSGLFDTALLMAKIIMKSRERERSFDE